MAAIDLYSGMGGWTLGFKMANIPVIASYEWWKDANSTHNKNFGSTHEEINIRTLSLSDLPEKENIRFVVGSPPCTQFSLANRGGKGDIADGLIDIKKFLEVVEYAKPQYWAMENVPRVASILEKELGKNGKLKQFKHLFRDIKVYTASDFGVPQDRKRMIAGNFPFELLEQYAKKTKRLTLGNVLDSLDQNKKLITDPIYGIKLKKGDLTDNVLEPNLSYEEERINRESKMHHPVYNVMSFPDRQDRPSRTITALCTRVSRESIVIRDARDNLRRLTVRERASIQSFPINYQLFSKSYAGKIKMIGNAIPPLLTFYIAQSMQETPVKDLLLPNMVQDRLVFSNAQAISHQPDNEGASYSWNRSFWMAIQGLRFGSGVRFDLKNHNDKETKSTTWRIGFFYGSSKNIKNKELDINILKRSLKATKLSENNKFMRIFNDLMKFINSIDESDLQKNWTNLDRNKMGPMMLIDRLAVYVDQFRDFFNIPTDLYTKTIEAFVADEFSNGNEKNLELRKLIENSIGLFIGICIGVSFNCIMAGQPINLNIRAKALA